MTRRTLRPHPASVGQARRLVRSALVDAGCDVLVETAEILVSEVVTNAVVHAATPVDVEAIVGGRGLRVEIGDGSPHPPVPRVYAGLAGTGRGLRLLEDLTDDWGVQQRQSGKVVWFELRTDDFSGPVHGTPGAKGAVGGALQRAGAGTDEPPDIVKVVLLRVPLLLHAAWQTHVESLLREYLLIRLEEDNAVAELEAHAAANDAMVLLRQHLPAPDVGADPEEVMTSATEPLVTAERIVLPVPADSLPHFQVLDDMLDAAAVLADAGELLTAPVQPEVRMLRRWLCQQVRDQAAGAEPTAWAPREQLPSRAETREWNPTELEDIAQAAQTLIAVNESNVIVAASSSVVTLLGYLNAGALVGQRLVEIIPERYRQAHLAGLTLHQATGRSTLLGRSVRVPALRHDGREVTVEMTVTARHHTGHSLFVAELRAAPGAEHGH